MGTKLWTAGIYLLKQTCIGKCNTFSLLLLNQLIKYNLLVWKLSNCQNDSLFYSIWTDVLWLSKCFTWPCFWPYFTKIGYKTTFSLMREGVFSSHHLDPMTFYARKQLGILILYLVLLSPLLQSRPYIGSPLYSLTHFQLFSQLYSTYLFRDCTN